MGTFYLSSEKENGYLSAFSDDFSPYMILAAEGATLEDLVREVNAEIQEAMEIVFVQPPKEPIATTFIPDIASA
ncbi:MAG: hypothetical protein LUC43_01010 [Burkholderiales bacterium]|nr:hypothetical protein [Burkholderiales bacterium]